MVYGRDFAQLTLCFWDQGGGPGSLAKGEREGLGRLLRLLLPHHKKGTG